jgi:predicted nucleic acid-binding protein
MEESALRVYLDMCCFNRPYDDQSQLKVRLETDAKLSIQSKIASGEYQLVWSYILDFENEQNPFLAKKVSIADWKTLASLDVDETDEIAAFAESLSAIGIKPQDALHIACAKASKCDYFITTDRKVLNKTVEGIEIISPIRFIEEVD